jgi:hypothetical protein
MISIIKKWILEIKMELVIIAMIEPGIFNRFEETFKSVAILTGG